MDNTSVRSPVDAGSLPAPSNLLH